MQMRNNFFYLFFKLESIHILIETYKYIYINKYKITIFAHLSITQKYIGHEFIHLKKITHLCVRVSLFNKI